MLDSKTLAEMIARRGRETPDLFSFRFLDEEHTFGTIFDRACRLAGLLQQRGVSHGDRVVMAIPNSAEFFDAFYGVLLLGAVAVPVFPGSGASRIVRIAGLCGAKTVIIPTGLKDEQNADYQSHCADAQLDLILADAARDTEPLTSFPEVKEEDLAFLQYTSGSTGDPKGVMLAHGGLMHNVRQLTEHMEITERDRFVSWLPVYHDMGLILMTMVPFSLGVPLYLLRTSLNNVKGWLQTITDHGCTLTAAPDFAYRLCLRYSKDDGYDLSSMRFALNAAEPVREGTIRDFEQAFGISNVMTAGYGLAEATVGVATGRPGKPIIVDERGLVSVGPEFPNLKLRIVEDGADLPAGEVGEIAIDSIANCKGYFGNPEATEALFLEDGSFLSGDMGYLDADGNLYIVGRKKNVIFSGGRTIANQEVEEVVDSHPEVRMSAAVGIDRGNVEGEQVYVFAESRRGASLSEEEQADVVREIVLRVHDGIGLRPARVYLIKKGVIPRTYNGKVRHAELRQRYVDGVLREDGSLLYPDF